jgi:hypothetical protein
MLRYLTVRDGLCYRTQREGRKLAVIMEGIEAPVLGDHCPRQEDVQGITFEAPAGATRGAESRSSVGNSGKPR